MSEANLTANVSQKQVNLRRPGRVFKGYKRGNRRAYVYKRRHIVGCRTYQKRGVKMDNTDKIEILNQALENLEGAQTLLLALARYLRENADETANALFVIEGTIFQNVSDLKSVFEDELTAYAKI